MTSANDNLLSKKKSLAKRWGTSEFLPNSRKTGSFALHKTPLVLAKEQVFNAGRVVDAQSKQTRSNAPKAEISLHREAPSMASSCKQAIAISIFVSLTMLGRGAHG